MDSFARDDAYEFKFIGEKNNRYLLDTDGCITYEVKFVPSGYLWE